MRGFDRLDEESRLSAYGHCECGAPNYRRTRRLFHTICSTSSPSSRPKRSTVKFDAETANK